MISCNLPTVLLMKLKLYVVSFLLTAFLGESIRSASSSSVADSTDASLELARYYLTLQKLCALRDSTPEAGHLFLGSMGATKAASACVSRTSVGSSPQAWPSTGDCKRLSIGLRRIVGTMTMSEPLDKDELERLKVLQLASRKPLPKEPWWKRLWYEIRGNSFGSREG
jgi:hypothetical protein